jgi:hypothetical protein
MIGLGAERRDSKLRCVPSAPRRPPVLPPAGHAGSSGPSESDCRSHESRGASPPDSTTVRDFCSAATGAQSSSRDLVAGRAMVEERWRRALRPPRILHVLQMQVLRTRGVRHCSDSPIPGVSSRPGDALAVAWIGCQAGGCEPGAVVCMARESGASGRRRQRMRPWGPSPK